MEPLLLKFCIILLETFSSHLVTHLLSRLTCIWDYFFIIIFEYPTYMFFLLSKWYICLFYLYYSGWKISHFTNSYKEINFSSHKENHEHLKNRLFIHITKDYQTFDYIWSHKTLNCIFLKDFQHFQDRCHFHKNWRLPLCFWYFSFCLFEYILCNHFTKAYFQR